MCFFTRFDRAYGSPIQNLKKKEGGMITAPSLHVTSREGKKKEGKLNSHKEPCFW